MPEPLATPGIAAPPLVRCGAEMIGVGTALPATVVPNAVIAEQLGIDAGWIVKRTGIEERRSAQPGERLFEFAAAAGAEALAEARVDAAKLDLIVLATTSNEELMPAAAPARRRPARRSRGRLLRRQLRLHRLPQRGLGRVRPDRIGARR